jgi:hypothetical protein
MSKVFEGIEQSPNDKRKYRHVTLPNKLEVCLVHDPLTVKSAAGCSVNVGSMSDPAEAQGCVYILISMLCCAVLCCAMLCYAVLCCAMLCYAMLYCAMLCYDVLCCVVLCCAMLCYAMLCYALPYYILLFNPLPLQTCSFLGAYAVPRDGEVSL